MLNPLSSKTLKFTSVPDNLRSLIKQEEPTTGRIVLISGPSGVGKGTVLNKLFSDTEIASSIVRPERIRTRPDRPKESSTDVKHVSISDFMAAKNTGSLFQFLNFNNHNYGVLLKPVVDALKKNKKVVIELFATDALKIKEQIPEIVDTVFISPPATEEKYYSGGLMFNTFQAAY